MRQPAHRGSLDADAEPARIGHHADDHADGAADVQLFVVTVILAVDPCVAYDGPTHDRGAQHATQHPTQHATGHAARDTDDAGTGAHRPADAARG